MSTTDQTRSPGDRHVGRRALLLVGAGAAVTAGCSLNNPFSDERTPAAAAIADLAPDVALAVTAVGALLAADTAAQRAVATFPALRGRVAGTIALHAAHLDALREAVPDGVDPTPQPTTSRAPGSRRAALTQQDRAERALHDTLVGLALRAESGAFARLLGSMAAATAQQLQAFPLVEASR